MKKISQTNKLIIRYAKSKGYLSPIWLLPNSNANRVQKAFHELDTFLNKSYLQGDILEVSLDDIEDFIWQLKKEFAFEGWDGIAPYLLSQARHKKELNVEPTINLELSDKI